MLQTALISSWCFSRYSDHGLKSVLGVLCCAVLWCDVMCAASITLSYFILLSPKALFVHVANIWVLMLCPQRWAWCWDTAVSKPGQVPALRVWSLMVESTAQLQDRGQDAGLIHNLGLSALSAVPLDYWWPKQIKVVQPEHRAEQQSKGGKWCSLFSGLLWASANDKGNWKYRLCVPAMQIKLGQVSYDLISFELRNNAKTFFFHNWFCLLFEHHFLNALSEMPAFMNVNHNFDSLKC